MKATQGKANPHLVNHLLAEKALVTAVTEYLREYNQAPTQCVWTKDADMILGKLRRSREALGTSH